MISTFRLAFASASLVLAALVGSTQAAHAAPVVYNFDAFGDGVSVTNQMPGLAFANATVLTAGVSLNNFVFPPHSGSNVVFDDGGGISIAFAAPVSSVAGYFTYATKLSFTVYDSANLELGSLTSAFEQNTVGGLVTQAVIQMS